MSIFEIVVGDMVQLNIGDQVSSCFPIILVGDQCTTHIHNFYKLHQV